MDGSFRNRAGNIFRQVHRTGKILGAGIEPKAIWHIVKRAARCSGIEKLAPHDLRSYAECRIMPNRYPCLWDFGLSWDIEMWIDSA